MINTKAFSRLITAGYRQHWFMPRLALSTIVVCLCRIFPLFIVSEVSALPQFDDNQHLGVATCASNVCHGKGKPDEDENVWLNEYRIWSTDDRHARAYQTLMSDESKRIARNLGLKNAHSAKICLDCHADNIAPDKRGPKFQINDGVGCEACHGGAQQWIESHTETDATHTDNLQKGMYATEDGVARAKLCLSCHYGTKDKLTTHRIMGAGHPRMSFELETFTANQPAHYAVDKDYLRRKGEFSGFTVWIVGQLESVKASLALIQEYVVSQNELMPELYFYDCHACHHPMSDIRWLPTAAKAGMPAGAIRLNDANILMLLESTQVLAPQKTPALKQALIATHKASVVSRGSLKNAVSKLSAVVQSLEPLLTEASYSTKQVKQVRARLLSQAARGEYRDFSAAEQAFLAIESITLALQQDASLEKQLDSLYDTLKDQDRFSPQKFKSVAKRVKSAFN
jgi:Cytochrome c554 and c-prime